MHNKPITVQRRRDGLYETWWHQEIDSVDKVCFQGNAAQTIIMLSRVIFQDEANETVQKQRKESDKIGANAIMDMKANPKKYVP